MLWHVICLLHTAIYLIATHPHYYIASRVSCSSIKIDFIHFEEYQPCKAGEEENYYQAVAQKFIGDLEAETNYLSNIVQGPLKIETPTSSRCPDSKDSPSKETWKLAQLDELAMSIVTHSVQQPFTYIFTFNLQFYHHYNTLFSLTTPSFSFCFWCHPR